MGGAAAGFRGVKARGGSPARLGPAGQPAPVRVACRTPSAAPGHVRPAAAPPCFRMRYVASYLLAALGGNSSPSAKDIKKILDSVGIEADDDRLNKVISELNGKNIEDVIAQAEEKKEEKKEESEESDDDMGFGLFD
ncbi:hypothetical protein G4228_001013 [Cervus hanglu yarkandensis]|nr:hypothetical protein G4228_001013 [Cervus hanglu yarkandensis]